MGIFHRFFSRREIEPKNVKPKSANLAFVLLSEARLPEVEAIARAFVDFAAPGESLQNASESAGENTGQQIHSLRLSTGERAFVALIPAAVPEGEAENAARYSLSSFGNDWKLPAHCAQLLVSLRVESSSSLLIELSRFTSLLAAVTKVAPAVGVYWGNAGATHAADFFLSIASDRDVGPRMMLWSGVSMVRKKDGRLSLLSLGMEQLNLPDLLLVAGKSSENIAIEMMFDLLTYVAERGQPLPEGDSVGRNTDEQVTIHYIPSPIDSSKEVLHVELP